MIGSLSPLHWIIIIGVIALLFGGGGKISGLMGDAAKGIKSFREGLKDEPDADKKPVEPVVLTSPEPAVRDDVKS